MNSRPAKSKAIACLRAPLIIGVVMLHANLFSLVTQWTGEAPHWPGWLIFYFRNIVNILFPQCVATFFLLSGYFFFTGEQAKNLSYFKEKWRSRVHTLLVPYILWNSIALLLFYVKSSNLLGGISMQSGEEFSVVKYLTGYWAFYYSGDIPVNGPLWFVRDLMVVSLFTPLLYCLLRNRWVGAVTLLLLLACVSCGVNIDIHGVDFYSILFFSVGAWMRLQRVNLENIGKKVGVTALVLYLPVSYFMFNLCDSPFYIAFSQIAVVIKFVALLYLLSMLYRSEVLKGIPKLSTRSFFVYALHGLIIGPVIKILYLLSGPTDNPLLLILISVSSVVIVLLLCSAAYSLMEKKSPSLLKLLSGGR